MDIFSLLEELQTLSRNGLNYAENPYDRERYGRLLELSCAHYAELLDTPSVEVKSKLSRELGQITPKLGAEAVIFNEAGEVLLMERSDGTGWCMPCGWVEPNERPVDAAVREVHEETGLEVAVRQLVGVFSKAAGTAGSPHRVVSVVHLCEVTGGELTLSHEGVNLRYWVLDEVPSWFANHERLAWAAHRMWSSNDAVAISD